MDVTALVEEIEQRVARMPAPNTAAVRAVRREYVRSTKELADKDVLKACAALIARRRVPRFLADEWLAARADAFGLLTGKQVERLGEGMSSWDQVDCFACILSGRAWKEGLIGDAAVVKWAKSRDRWWRRAALVSTVPLNLKARGGEGDARRTLAICRLLLDDRDEMVVKALSWALRVLAMRDADSVRQFLAENGDRMAALVRREVRNKLETGLKTPRASKSAR